MRRLHKLRLATVLLVLGSASPLPAEEAPRPPRADAILRHLRALGDDAMQGRGTGTPGGELAASYIEERLSEDGLQPRRQAVPLHGSLPLGGSRLSVVSEDGAGEDGDAKVLTLWDDYVLFRTGAQTFLPRPVPLVFVAYGIVAPEYDYNDYLRADVAGKIAVFLAGEPPSSDDAFFDGPKPTVYSDPEMKFRTALSRGARGAILLPSPREDAFLDWKLTLASFKTEDVTLLYGPTGSLNVLLRFEKAPLLFAGAPASFIEVLKRDALGTLDGFPLKVRASFEGAFRERDFVAYNLVAQVEGSDPLLRESYVVMSAHYDHLGVGEPVDGDAIYNGVIDNASGTAVNLEIARALAEDPVKPKRSIVFLFFTGEEKGLLGSRYYCDHPVFPLYRTVAALNVDGISFIDATDVFVGVGAELSTLGTHLEETLQGLGLRRGEVPAIFQMREPFYNSDQLSFAQAGVPSILVMEGFGFRGSLDTGIRRFLTWSGKRYHTPSDDLLQPLDTAAMEQHAQVLLAFVRRLGDTYTEPQWLPGAPFVGARLRSLAEKR